MSIRPDDGDPALMGLGRGALLVVLAEVMFTLMGTTIKALDDGLPNEVVVFFRNLFALFLVLPLAARPRGQGLATDRLGLHLVRSLTGLAAMYCFFYALATIPMALAVVLALTQPLFIPWIARIWLGEPIGRIQALAAGVGFLGVLVILAPGSQASALEPGAFVAVLGGVLAATAKVTIRRLGRSEPTTRIVVYFAGLATLFSTPAMVVQWQMPTAPQWALLAAIGLLASLGQLLLTRAYHRVPAAQIGPFTYVAVPLAAFWGWLFWAEPVSPRLMLGAPLVIAAGVLVLTHRDGSGSGMARARWVARLARLRKT